VALEDQYKIDQDLCKEECLGKEAWEVACHQEEDPLDNHLKT
jgi:hypothetical protein